MAVKLHEKGVFTWTEWAQCLSAEIKAASGDSERDEYYEHWLAALEKMVEAKSIITRSERLQCKAAWDRAARATPHGRPIELTNG